MKERKHYFSLKFKGTNAYHKHDKHIKITDRITNIGETPDCDIRFEAGAMEPLYYASIIQNEDGKSWRIVKRSQYVDVSIVGRGNIGYVHLLNDGDIIQFGRHEMALVFHSHFDNHYDEENKSYIWQWALACIVSLLSVIVAILIIGGTQDEISVKDVEPLEESVFMVKVDSVRQILLTKGKKEWIPPTIVLAEETPTGTAFLTTDGVMITARHCVEYWIAKNLDLTTKVSDLKEDDIVRKAIETETFNQQHDSDSLMQLQVFFSLFDFIGNKKYSFASTDKNVHINKQKDGVLLLADFSQDYYWRTIRPYFTDRQMELGDILWIDSIPEKGKFYLSSNKKLKQVKNGTRLMICGYPMTGIGDKRMTITDGTIRRNTSTETENLYFESNINHGFSGGPVLIKTGDDVVAIGVVSRVDSVSSGLYKWAVPVSELNNKY